MRRLTALARQTAAAIESERLSAAGVSTAHLGRINPQAAEELDAASAGCPVIAAEAWPDWDSPARIRESAEIAHRLLRRAVAPALDLACPDPGAVRLANPADQIAKQTDREVQFRC